MTLIGTSTNLIVDGIARQAGMPAFGIFEVTPYGAAGAAAGLVGLLLLAWLLPSDAPSEKPGDEDANVHDYLTELIVREDDDAIGQPVSKLNLGRQGIELLAIRRNGSLRRDGLDEWTIEAGDRLVARAKSVAIITLREANRFDIGFSGSRPMATGEGEVVEGMIAPNHPSIGQRVSDLPSLRRLRMRILGIARERHFPGPMLAEARVRGADRLLVAGPEESLRDLRDNHDWMGVNISRARAFRRDKAPIAILSMTGVVTLSALDIMPISVAAVLAIGIILATRCIDGEEAWKSIDGDVLILIFAMLAVGVALEQTGSVDLMVSWLAPLMMQAPGWALVFIVYFFALILSELLSNNAVAAIMTPITIALAEQLGVDPRPLVIALMLGASLCFATPIGYQTNMMVYAAADYRFSDFVKVGIPLNIIVGVAVCWALVTLY
jgi:di/tricarboxylate transporter